MFCVCVFHLAEEKMVSVALKFFAAKNTDEENGKGGIYFILSWILWAGCETLLLAYEKGQIS